MPVWVVTGRLGSGKSIGAVGRAVQYLNRGCPVATNCDLFPERFKDTRNRSIRILRLPDHPTAADLYALGSGNEEMDESRNGLVMLDECATWLNARTYNDAHRANIIEWVLHARKYGWDCIFIVQHISLLDRQIRESVAEYLVTMSRLDRMSIPIISPLYKAITGSPIKFPQYHIGTVRYGLGPLAPVAERWMTRGVDVRPLYDTRQAFAPGGPGLHCLLTPWHLVGRYQPRPRSAAQVLAGLLFGPLVHAANRASGAIRASRRRRLPLNTRTDWINDSGLTL